MSAGRRWRGATVALALVLGVGCAQDTDLRPEIRYGEHECDRCRMIVSEERTAAVALLEGGAYRFDDLACLGRWANERDLAQARVWVHDAVDLTWLPADQALYAQAPRVVTPMGSGWLAFSDAEGLGVFDVAPREALEWSGFRVETGEDDGAARAWRARRDS